MNKENSPHYYKIVETEENGRKLLSAVPRSWEKSGRLMWPPHGKKKKALKQPENPPGSIIDGWTEHSCVLKRSYIPSYSQALAEVCTMSGASDTTENEVVRPNRTFSGPRKRKIRLNENPDMERCNFNSYLEMETTRDEGLLSSKKSNMVCEPAIQSICFEENEESAERPQPGKQMFLIGNDGEVILFPQNESQPVAGVEGLIVSLVDSVAKLQTKQDHLIKLVETLSKKLEEKSTNFVPVPYEEAFKPVETVEELEELELNLTKKEFFEDLYRRLSSICCPRSEHRGENVCYKKVDAIFSRKLFVLVSWSGVSRTKKNENFSRFVNVFKFFHSLVKRVDPEFSEVFMKHFFQKVINNSRRRLESLESEKPQRASRVKIQGFKQPRAISYDDGPSCSFQSQKQTKTNDDGMSNVQVDDDSSSSSDTEDVQLI